MTGVGVPLSPLLVICQIGKWSTCRYQDTDVVGAVSATQTEGMVTHDRATQALGATSQESETQTELSLTATDCVLVMEAGSTIRLGFSD